MSRPTTAPVRIPEQRRTGVERPGPARSVLVVVPTGAGGLPATVDRLRAAVPGAGLLVVDDGTPAGTGRIADATDGDTGVHVLHRRGIGVGAACVTGFAWAIDRGYDVIVQMDADGSHDPADLPRLLAALADAHVVVGSRFVPGGIALGGPLHRTLLSRWGNGYARAVLGLDVHDPTSGFRALRAEVVKALPLRRIAAAGRCFPVELVRQCVRAGFRVREVPIVHTGSPATGSPLEAAEALCRITRWALPGGDR
jgi:dolichol-phosphate mannosyltransferase